MTAPFNSMMENVKIVPVYSYNTMGSARTSDRVSLENYSKCGFLVQCYQAAGSAVAITVDAYTAATSGSTSSGITLTNWWKLEDTVVGALTTDTWTKGTAAASITNSASSSGTSYYWIEINADELTISGTNYPFVAALTGSGSASNIVSMIAFLWGARYAQAALPTALA